MPLKPKSILKNFKLGKIDKETAIKGLITLIDNSENDTIRENSIEILGEIGSNNKSLFKILEYLFISDSNEKIRISAFNALKKIFPLEAFKPISHAIEKENGDFLVSLAQFLEEMKFLINKIKIFDSNYLNFILKGTDLKALNFIDLKELIFNYLMYISFNYLYFHRHKIPLALDFYDINFLLESD